MTTKGILKHGKGFSRKSMLYFIQVQGSVVSKILYQGLVVRRHFEMGRPNKLNIFNPIRKIIC